MIKKKLAGAVVLVLLIASLMPFGASAQALKQQSARHIIICIDGVGISTINKLRAEGRFQMFAAPSYMISPFPSVTNPAMSEILEAAGARPVAGYEDNYFDVEQNKMRGGIIDRFRGDRFIRGTFRELFDYHPSALKSGLGYAAPPFSTYLEALTDLIRLRQKARGSRQPVFLAYTGATDSLAHLGGEWFLKNFLKHLGETVKDIVRESKEPVTVTLFSDHGNEFRKYRRMNLKASLRRAGFRLEKRIKDDRSVVLPQFGLVGSAMLFTREANEQRLAQTAAGVEGVDFAAYEKEGIVHVLSHDGEAMIEKRVDRYRYKSAKGDPLDLNAVVQSLAAERKVDADGFIADADWFAATRDGVRPDAVRRVYEGATGGVANRANVILNLRDGYYNGSSLLDLFTILQATHGNMGQGQSYGFVMSNSGALPPYIRAEDVWQAIGAPLLTKAR
ncbi:MAG TPA: hypothetical protein VF658_00390 [Pyrinomonadaceae bacterium]|jgi:hypothetical protein